MAPVTLHHDVSGPDGAPVLVLGSSLGTTLAMWDAQVAPLSERLRVVRYDHRGHGGSPVPPGPYELADLAGDVLGLLDELGVARASFGGVSLGGMVSMWLGAHAPARVDAVIAGCTSAFMAPASLWQERAAAVLEAGSTEPIADTVVDRWLTPPFAAEFPEVRARLRALLVASPPDGYAACCGAIERMDLRPDLPRISAPTLVISAANDLATPPEHQQLIAAAVPGARLESLTPAAHIANVERPAEVTRLVLDHLAAL